jgi:hypothetical protein
LRNFTYSLVTAIQERELNGGEAVRSNSRSWSGGFAVRSSPIIVEGKAAGQERVMAQQPELPKDWLEFMQKMWNPMSFPMPGMAMPTVDVGDVEKKIAELKAVENWLTLQVGFVQMTVKTLEMQKAALESLAAAAPKGKPEAKR